MVQDAVAAHYGGEGDLTQTLVERLKKAGKSLEGLTTLDLAPVDEMHIGGREATLQLAERMNLSKTSRVLDIGSGLGGPARTVAETYGCPVVGIDLTPSYCDTANVMSDWVGLADVATFVCGDATKLPFRNDEFDAAMTIHAAMSIPDKAAMYREAGRVLKSGGIFAVYDVLQGEGGGVVFPVPWAREPSISFLATADEMKTLLTQAGLKLVDVLDSTEESEAWFKVMAKRMAQVGPPPVSFQAVLGDDFPEMARNQVRNLAERRIRTITYICEA